MKSMNRKEGKKIGVMAAVIVGLMMFAFMPAASAGVTSFTVTPSTGIVGAVDSHDIFVTTTGVTSINITIPAGFIAVAPGNPGEEIARVDFWNSSIKAYYGHAIITAGTNPAAQVDIDCEFGDDAITTTQNVDYTAGKTNVFTSGFACDHSSATIKLPTETLEEGYINITINCTKCPCFNGSWRLDAVAISIGEFVRNPLTAGNYDFEANGKTATVEILPIPPMKVYLKRYRDAAWYIDTDGNGGPDWSFWFAFAATDKPVVGDINQDDTEDIAFFHEGAWYVNTTPSGGVVPVLIDLQFWYGWDGDTPVVGDIDRDGIDDIAIVHDEGTRCRWYVSMDGDNIVDNSFLFGYPGDTPLVGNIDQIGNDDIAYFDEGAWYVSTDGDNIPEYSFWYGYATSTPVVGDFNQDGKDDIAYFHEGAWYIDTNFDRIPDISVWYGFPGDTPVGGGKLG